VLHLAGWQRRCDELRVHTIVVAVSLPRLCKHDRHVAATFPRDCQSECFMHQKTAVPGERPFSLPPAYPTQIPQPRHALARLIPP
ncbi:MAG: hypothetical protein R6X34_29515, partial [Chloroflexota bacterium]